ncbi:MAG: tetratricopeptide repeat protein [Calditrichaeota bacterium]|nr:MAG: tetratricopeptide repeat protein [Calditrichota bacterium]
MSGSEGDKPIQGVKQETIRMLKAKKKLSKKELKQDQFLLLTAEIKEYVEQHSKQITAGLVALLIIVVAVVMYRNSKQQAELDAAARLSDAQVQFQNGQKDNGIAILTEIVDQYEGTSAAAQSTFLLAKLYWQDEDIDNARIYFKRFIDEYGGDDFLTQAALAGYADCLVYEKNYAEAAKYYEKAAKINPDFPQSVDFLFSAAMAYKDAGDTLKARELAQRVINEFNNPNLKNRAELLLASLD